MPLEAVASTILPVEDCGQDEVDYKCLASASWGIKNRELVGVILFMMIVLPVPPGASRNVSLLVSFCL
jgi:hypothetical protein